jgi:hexosaminidase
MTQLLPQPRELHALSGQYTLASDRLILIDSPEICALRFTALRIQKALSDRGIGWPIVAAASAGEVGLRLRHDPQAAIAEQGYQLSIQSDGIEIVASTAAGVFYGVCTLIQLLEDAPNLPCVQINDAPDFSARGVMFDISRNRVPTLATLKQTIDRLAGWKINEVQLYTEHTFQYQAHREVWENASPITGQDILELDAFCRERFIDLVPNQNSFGHLHNWLEHPRYQHLAETLEEFTTPWNTVDQGPFGLAPEEPGSLPFLQGLFDELLPHFSSNMFNVGCDETIDLGQGKSKQIVEERGEGRVYLDFVLKIYEEVRKRGKQMQFWGDIIIQYPELIQELPKDAIALEWGYEANHPFAEHCPQFGNSGLSFYVCPGTSSWCTIVGRTTNAIGNLKNAAIHGKANNAKGYLITDWGDRGHWNHLSVSYLGYVAGANFSWNAESEPDIAQQVSQFAFGDPSGAAGQAVYDLGNVYLNLPLLHNSIPWFWMLQMSLADLREPQISLAKSLVPRFREAFNAETLEPIAQAIREQIAKLNAAQLNVPDAEIIKREYTNAANMLLHACKRGILVNQSADADTNAELLNELNELIEEYRAVWLLRNRPGGLDDSAGRLEKLRYDYQA